MTGKFVSVRKEGQDFYGCFQKFDDFKFQDARFSDGNDGRSEGIGHGTQWILNSIGLQSWQKTIYNSL